MLKVKLILKNHVRNNFDFLVTFSGQFMQLAQKNEKLGLCKVYELNYKSAAEAGKNFKAVYLLY